MKFKFLIISALFIFSFSSNAISDWVNGYTKSNGTYVQGYNRSSRNNTVKDNYSYSGNTNPYTGSTGTNKNYGSPRSDYYKGNSQYGTNKSNRW